MHFKITIGNSFKRILFTSKELHSKPYENEIEISKERCVSPKKRQQIIDKLSLLY